MYICTFGILLAALSLDIVTEQMSIIRIFNFLLNHLKFPHASNSIPLQQFLDQSHAMLY